MGQNQSRLGQFSQSPQAYVFLLTISSAFYPLVRVLFTFPSQYFFAISLVKIFSFRWDQPPVLGLQSQTTRLEERTIILTPWIDAYGTVTLCGRPFKASYTSIGLVIIQSKNYNSSALKDTRFQVWALLTSFANTKSIPVGFFSSAY